LKMLAARRSRRRREEERGVSRWVG
jgi:hypothetical protein